MLDEVGSWPFVVDLLIVVTQRSVNFWWEVVPIAFWISMGESLLSLSDEPWVSPVLPYNYYKRYHIIIMRVIGIRD
jgi:hypothetical protein